MSYTTTNGGASPVSATVQSSFAATATFRSSLLIVSLPRYFPVGRGPHRTLDIRGAILIYSFFIAGFDRRIKTRTQWNLWGIPGRHVGLFPYLNHRPARRKCVGHGNRSFSHHPAWSGLCKTS